MIAKQSYYKMYQYINDLKFIIENKHDFLYKSLLISNGANLNLEKNEFNINYK